MPVDVLVDRGPAFPLDFAMMRPHR